MSETFYTNSINKALDYIDSNLCSTLSLDKIAGEAGISKYHFHRIYQSFTGESLYSAVLRMKAERAAARLVNERSLSITDLAFELGFNDSATFSRAFKRRFGCSPSRWRRENSKIDQAEPADSCYTSCISESDGPEADYAGISTFDEFSIAYIRHTGSFEGDSSLFMFLYSKLAEWAEPRNLLNYPETKDVVVYHDPLRITEDARLRLSLGITVPNETSTGGDIGKMRIKSGTYLVCRYRLKEDQYGPAWRQVYRKWLPYYNLVPVDGFCFEIYPRINAGAGCSLVEICVPVRKL